MRCESLQKKMEIFAILGLCSHLRAPIGVKSCMAKQTHVPLDCAKFHVNLCNESPLWGENADFQLVSKFELNLNTG